MSRTTYRLDPKTQKLITLDVYFEQYGPDDVRGHSVQIMEDIKPFVSPIDKTVISSRPHLEAHNRKHGVTNIADYGDQHYRTKSQEIKDRATGNTLADKRQRQDVIARELHKRGM